MLLVFTYDWHSVAKKQPSILYKTMYAAQIWLLKNKLE